MQKVLDPTKMPDWQIAESAEEFMKPITQVAGDMGILDEELMPYGKYVGKLDFMKIMNRLQNRPDGKLIDVTAITPTPLGEGKSTTTIGLIQGLGVLGQKVTGAIRQPSGGPTFNIKGSAAGGGLSQCIPLSEFSLGLTGDIDAITNAHNLAMVALTSRMSHEFYSSDSFLEKRNLGRLNIDPRSVSIKWAIDFCAQQLRQIISGLGGRRNGFMMESGFQISVSSELMAILAVARDPRDFRARIGQMIVAYDKSGKAITTADLEVDGAMTAIMSRAIYPNIMQTLEGQPILVHGGPFANIAIGQSSIIADRIGLKLADYHVTESGFGADIGFEKFWNLKCRFGGMTPDCAVLVVTVRALKMHGGGPDTVPGKPLDIVYTQSNPDYVERGVDNMLAHIDIIKKSGVVPVVCINHFYTDHDDEIEIIRNAAASKGVRVAVSKHWEKGGAGAVELAKAVMEACEEPKTFRYLYSNETPLKDKIYKIATEIYGADGVKYSPEAIAKIHKISQDEVMKDFGVCMAKTQLSLSDNSALKNRPKGWELFIRDVLVYQGAGFVVPVAGEITLMPGTASDANFRRIDMDLDTWRVKGLM